MDAETLYDSCSAEEQGSTCSHEEGTETPRLYHCDAWRTLGMKCLIPSQHVKGCGKTQKKNGHGNGYPIKNGEWKKGEESCSHWKSMSGKTAACGWSVVQLMETTSRGMPFMVQLWRDLRFEGRSEERGDGPGLRLCNV